MRAPSVKTLLSHLRWIDEKQAATVRGLIRGDIKPDTIPATAAWLRECYGRPSDIELTMHAINAVIECHGVESIDDGRTYCGRYLAPRAIFANTGETYCDTIIYDYKSGTYKVQSFGDFVECNKL